MVKRIIKSIRILLSVTNSVTHRWAFLDKSLQQSGLLCQFLRWWRTCLVNFGLKSYIAYEPAIGARLSRGSVSALMSLLCLPSAGVSRMLENVTMWKLACLSIWENSKQPDLMQSSWGVSLFLWSLSAWWPFWNKTFYFTWKIINLD